MDIPAQVETHVQPQTPTPMNRKTRYYYNHKDDPVFRAKMSEAKRRYYQKNKAAIIAKTLNRYYAIKALQNQEHAA